MTAGATTSTSMTYTVNLELTDDSKFDLDYKCQASYTVDSAAKTLDTATFNIQELGKGYS